MKLGKHYKNKGRYLGIRGNAHVFDKGYGRTYHEETYKSYIENNKVTLLSIVLSGIGVLISLFAAALHYL